MPVFAAGRSEMTVPVTKELSKAHKDGPEVAGNPGPGGFDLQAMLLSIGIQAGAGARVARGVGGRCAAGGVGKD